MRLAYNEEIKKFKGYVNGYEIWVTNPEHAQWYADNKMIKGCKMITYEEAKTLKEKKG